MSRIAEVEEKAKEKVKQTAEKTKEAAKHATESAESAMEATRAIPPLVYLGFTVGSIVFSLVLFFRRKREEAIFVGLWPPTFLLTAMFLELLGKKRS